MKNLEYQTYLAPSGDLTPGSPEPSADPTGVTLGAPASLSTGKTSTSHSTATVAPVATTVTTTGPMSIEDLVNEYRSPGTTASRQSDGYASEAQINGVILYVLENNHIPATEQNKVKVKGSILALAQEGATSPKFAQNRVQDVFGLPVKVKDIKDGTAKHGTTIRKIARSLRNDAYLVAEALQIPGNLSKSYLIDHPEADLTDLYWVSDFQTFNNDPAIPEQVRIWLLTNFKKRFKKD
jgi:hypothetical protein